MDRLPIKTATTVSATVEFPGDRLNAFNAMIEEFKAGDTRWDAAAADAQRARASKQEQGVASLKRLFDFAEKNRTGSSRVIAAFLASIYNGGRFRMDLTELRLLGSQFHQDVLHVLAMDHVPELEIHHYFEGGGDRFERMFESYELLDLMNASAAMSQIEGYDDEQLRAALKAHPRAAERLRRTLAASG